MIPTSNHNDNLGVILQFTLYIFWFLHQTTTLAFIVHLLPCCISFDSYIKPQPIDNLKNVADSCISFDSYIKPQLSNNKTLLKRVVYLLIPTSNHNFVGDNSVKYALYIFWFLHQTTTSFMPLRWLVVLYIFWFLHQTTTITSIVTIPGMLYIFWFLHQTTTLLKSCRLFIRCISFDSYIKPQPCDSQVWWRSVVYLLIPTSNHNILTNRNIDSVLYIFWFLHQTTTLHCEQSSSNCCISFDSYIKPQLRLLCWALLLVVYLLIPTSNHNLLPWVINCILLYIFWFLHQTTT